MKIFLPLVLLLMACQPDQIPPEEVPTTPESPQSIITPESPQSIQQAFDQAPGRIHYLPPGDYPISAKLVINKHNTGLAGPGRIIQMNPNMPILEIENANNVQIRDVTLTRAEGQMDADANGIIAANAHNLTIANVQVLDNRSQKPAISFAACRGVRVIDCTIQNYSRIAVDDRTKSSGFAFNCIDGSGINVNGSRSVLIRGCRIVELNLLPSPENKEKFQLGKWVKKVEGAPLSHLVPRDMWDKEYSNNWHQGSALVVTDPSDSDYVQIIGNEIENAAQGIDIHGDHVIVANNIVSNAFIGMKAMHGARNVLIIGNQFSKNDLWSIGLMPGVSSQAAGAKPANVDGGSIIANNIISDFGYGSSQWIWPGQDNCPIRLDRGQVPENPPLTDVLIQGNIVYDTGRDKVVVDGVANVVPPRYDYAVYVSGDEATRGPVGLHFSDNLFHPGLKGISNVSLDR
jgi:hypothetical protein